MNDSRLGLFILVSLSLTACSIDVSQLDAGDYACSNDSHCAPDYACNLATGFCILGSTGDTTTSDSGTDGTDTSDSGTDDTTPNPTCGNGIVDEGETCDDGNAETETCAYGERSCTVCDETCQEVDGAISFCGDNSVDAQHGETCDDGNSDDDDGCSANCLTESEGPFISIWQTTEDGESITLPLREEGCTSHGECGPFNYNFTVDWGDGSAIAEVSAYDDPNITHTYATAGHYTITIDGLMETIYFNNIAPARNQIRSIPNLGNVGWTSFEAAFRGCGQLTTVAGGDTSQVTDMDMMFLGATLVTPDTTNWDTSSVTDMTAMFEDAAAANPDTSNWNTSNVLHIDTIFKNATMAEPNTTNWNTSRVLNMSNMFNGAEAANPDTSNWSTSNVELMREMFINTTNANPDTSNWNTSNVTDMSLMFTNAISANPDMSQWSFGNVTDMDRMFEGLDIGTTKYSNLLIRLESQNANPNVALDGGNATYNEAGAAARSSLITDHGWTISDGGLSASPSIPSNMALVPAGHFIYGDPSTTMNLPDFYIDQYPVTAGDYKSCVDAGECTYAGGGGTYNNNQDDHPINYVNWSHASTYCSWLGKRLPTEQEWEKAARGTDGRTYPWGEEAPDGTRSNYHNSGDPFDNGTTPVGFYDSTSPYGAYDMAGNVWEWTDSFEGSSEPVLRGGSFLDGGAYMRVAHRTSLDPSERSSNIGFRCAQ